MNPAFNTNRPPLFDKQGRREWIRRMNACLPPGRNRWFLRRSNAHRAALATARRLRQQTGHAYRVHHHIYQPTGLGHYHLAQADGRPVRRRFIYIVADDETAFEVAKGTQRRRIIRTSTRRVSTDAKPNRHMGMLIQRSPAGRNPYGGFTRYGGRVIQPASVSRTRPKGYRRPSGVALHISPALRKQIAVNTWTDFKKKRADYAKRLKVRSGEDVHHAIERQVLTRYPGVFTQQQINSFENMRGIPQEIEGRKQLQNPSIGQMWI